MRTITILGQAAACALTLLLAAPVPVKADEALKFDIAVQPLVPALKAFAEQANMQLLYKHEAVETATSNAVIGSYSRRDALMQLLRGTGLEAVFINDDAATIRSRMDVSANRERAAVADPAALRVAQADDLQSRSSSESGDNESSEGALDDSSQDRIQEITVTGSRIRRSLTDTPAPVSVITAQDMMDRGYVQAGQALNAMSSIAPSFPVAPGTGRPAGSGQQFPDLFGLGAGRTLTLVDGRRFVTSSSGLGDRVVDTNLIPTGLIERVDVVQAGGAAVYGSDAIAGVINFVLKKDFEGIELDAQTGISSRGDYPQTSLRTTLGRNFADGRANLAANVEWSKTDSLLYADRSYTNPVVRISGNNPANVSSSDGIPALVSVYDTRFWSYNTNGVIFREPAPSTAQVIGQLTPDGTGITDYDPGRVYSAAFASGGEGYSYGGLSALYSGVERLTANVIGGWDLTDRLRLSGSLMYGRTRGTDPYGTQGAAFSVLNRATSGKGPIAFFNTNPYLTAGQIATLAAAAPGFATGSPLYLSKYFEDFLPTRAYVATTDTFRPMVSLEGELNIAARDFYYSASYSRGVVDGKVEGWDFYSAHRDNAANAVRNSAGEIVCAINGDASALNDDLACVPFDPFAPDGISDASRAYMTLPVGSDYRNTQDDFLLTFGGDVIRLPGGGAKFSLAYEHREESAEFVPSAAQQQGLTGTGAISVPASGRYDTDEVSGEVLVPVLGPDFNLPFAQALDLSGQYRLVDNSLAGREKVWGLGLHWQAVDGLALRASRSRNFRAPTLTQLLAPASTGLTQAGPDPCDERFIDTGPNPAVRRANCEALFAANPTYNDNTGSVVGYQDQASNFLGTLVTTGGNPNLRNEISDTTTWGIVLNPDFVPGLTITADRIELDLTDGLSAFALQDFTAACFDSIGMPADVCGTFTRNANGDLATGLSTTFNAGSVRFRGEIYNLNYDLPIGSLTGRPGWGTLGLTLQATHTSRLDTSVTGFDLTHYAGTTATPDWVTRLDAQWVRGDLRVTYQGYFLPDAKVNFTDTIETNDHPVVSANARHNVSASYDFGRYQVRAGISNLTDEKPSFPTLNYGDILGRQYWAGLQAQF